MEGAIVFAPALASLCIGLWQGKNISRWCLAGAIFILALSVLSVPIVPLMTRAIFVALALMGGAGLVGPALFTSKAPAIVASLFAALLAWYPTASAAFYAAMSYACQRGPCY